MDRFFPPRYEETPQSVLRGCSSVSAVYCRVFFFKIRICTYEGVAGLSRERSAILLSIVFRNLGISQPTLQ